MPRPFRRREIGFAPGVTYFKPAGVPLRGLEEVVVTLDEVEAFRLADLLGLYHEEAAGQMKVSRPTFGRVLESARRKIADAVINGKALRLEGGPVIQSSGGGWGRGRGGCGRGRGGRGRFRQPGGMV